MSKQVMRIDRTDPSKDHVVVARLEDGAAVTEFICNIYTLPRGGHATPEIKTYRSMSRWKAFRCWFRYQLYRIGLSR